jgi:carbon monoxide dehydrogenase subunit G
MKLQNEFTVSVPTERVWETLLDIERVATFLPGATLQPGNGSGDYRGSMKVKLGPMVVNYDGTARLASVDEGTRTAAIDVRARESKGQGTASAVIRNRLIPQDGNTRVLVETDLQVTGRQAQFGRGIMEDVASRMLDEFARRFESHLTGAPGVASSGAATTAGESADARGGQTAATSPRDARTGGPAPQDDVLDLGGVLSQTPVVRYGIPVAAGIGLLGLLLVLVRGRPRRRFKLSFRLEA